MKITALDHKDICILGFGREGRATLAVLEQLAPHAQITVADQRPVTDLAPKYGRREGDGYLDDLPVFDYIIKSPGIAWNPPAELGGKVTSATQIFLDSLPAGARTIGVTGTKGKSTTASLVYQLLRSAGLPAHLAGNIGEPMINLLPTASSGDIYVLELSSYQLQDLTASPQVAVVTSFFPDHTDYHGSLEAYLEAKTHITRFQSPHDVVFFNADYPECRQIAGHSPGRQVSFTAADAPAMSANASLHANPGNLAAAALVARELGLSDEQINAGLANAAGLPHRQEVVGTYNDVTWIDDSAASAPEATQAALSALSGRIGSLIVGGKNRSYDFTNLAADIAKSGIATVILFPETGALIRDTVKTIDPATAITFFETDDMTEAVNIAAAHTPAGKICLLSSGSPSYNLYKNFNERGDAFKQAVTALTVSTAN